MTNRGQGRPIMIFSTPENRAWIADKIARDTRPRAERPTTPHVVETLVRRGLQLLADGATVTFTEPERLRAKPGKEGCAGKMLEFYADAEVLAALESVVHDANAGLHKVAGAKKARGVSKSTVAGELLRLAILVNF